MSGHKKTEWMEWKWDQYQRLLRVCSHLYRDLSPPQHPKSSCCTWLVDFVRPKPTDRKLRERWTLCLRYWCWALAMLSKWMVHDLMSNLYKEDADHIVITTWLLLFTFTKCAIQLFHVYKYKWQCICAMSVKKRQTHILLCNPVLYNDQWHGYLVFTSCFYIFSLRSRTREMTHAIPPHALTPPQCLYS